MYFHRASYRSDVINTDDLGFRFSRNGDERASVGELPQGPVKLFVGSSTALGIGSQSDAATIPSRLWSSYAPSTPWLNFGGRSYSSAQELMLFTLYRHLLPRVEEIVIFSGLNNLALARLPESQRLDHGAFFHCGEFFDQMEELKARHRKAKLGFGRRGDRKSAKAAEDTTVRPLGERISYAVELTVRHLDTWRLFADAMGAKISFVLQPLATWVRDEHSAEEKLLFGELDKISNFWQLYGDIATKESGRAYAEELRGACEKIDVPFLDINPVIASAVTEQNWMFVDRAHFTDEGHDIVARLLAEHVGLS